jgi:hypothetical protein
LVLGSYPIPVNAASRRQNKSDIKRTRLLIPG